MKKNTDLEMLVISYLRSLINIIALALCVLLIIIAGYMTIQAFSHMFISGLPSEAISDALFVVILLELFYAIRSFVKRGSMNVGVIVNIGVIAAVKELVFKLDTLTTQIALAFSAIFISLGILYVLEVIHYERKRDDDEK